MREKRCRRSSPWLGFCLLSLLSMGTFAEDGGTRPLDLFALGSPTFKAFTVSDGVPEAAVTAIATDADGFVWIGSTSGLARYDGRRWEPFGDPRTFSQVTGLLLDREGMFRASLNDRGLARFDGGEWVLEGPSNGLPTQQINRLAETVNPRGDTETWALSADAGLFRRSGARWRAEPGCAQIPRGTLMAIARTRDIGAKDRLWIATSHHGLWYREDGGEWRRFHSPGFDPGQVNDLLVTREGGREELWVASFGHGLWRLTASGIRRFCASSGDLPSDMVYRVKETLLPGGDRALWVATRDGLARLYGGEARAFDRRHGLPSNAVRDLHVWRSPSGVDVLWIATEGGVARTVAGAEAWTTASLMGSTSNGVFGVLVEPDGRDGERLWLAASKDGIGLYERGLWRTFQSATDGSRITYPRLLLRAPDEDGRFVLWAGAEGELYRVEEGPRFERIPTPWAKGSAQAVMDLLARRVDGRYERWIATRTSGIYRFRDGTWTAFRPEGVVGDWRIVKLVEQVDRQGHSWLWASTNQGLARFDGSDWTLLGSEAGLPAPELIGLTLMPEPGGRATLWAGSSRNGVVRFDITDPAAPRALPAGDLPSPPDPFVYGALRDSRGRIYLPTALGVQQLVPKPSGGYVERTYARRDGMVHEDSNTNAQMIDAHDRFWTGTMGGLSVFDPSVLPDRFPKPLKLTHVRVDGAETGRDPVRVTPGTRQLRFDFALLAWHRESESSFRSQLVGYDPEPGPWVPQNYRVFGEVRPGRYTLRIEARDFAGLESPPLEIPVEVIPAFWQALWFRATAIALLALGGWLFFRHRLRRITRQKAELERLVTTRTADLAAANERLAELSHRDGLTGVANRRRLDEAIDEEWRRAARGDLPLSLLMLDIDDFKAYNDHYGHQAGDACLQEIARVLTESHRRAGELVGRYGGEEFAVLMPGVDLEEARARAHVDRRSVLDRGLTHEKSSTGSVVTVSLGVATARPARGSSPAELILGADRALYRAKREGKNRVIEGTLV